MELCAALYLQSPRFISDTKIKPTNTNPGNSNEKNTLNAVGLMQSVVTAIVYRYNKKAALAKIEESLMFIEQYERVKCA